MSFSEILETFCLKDFQKSLPFPAFTMLCTHWGRVVLWSILAASQETFIEQQQHALDIIAEQIRNDGAYTSCAAPQLASCGTSSCYGSSCGTFNIEFTAAKEVTYLFEMEFAVLLFVYFVVAHRNATFSSSKAFQTFPQFCWRI